MLDMTSSGGVGGNACGGAGGVDGGVRGWVVIHSRLLCGLMFSSSNLHKAVQYVIRWSTFAASDIEARVTRLVFRLQSPSRPRCAECEVIPIGLAVGRAELRWDWL